jgi:hypothetical protein
MDFVADALSCRPALHLQPGPASNGGSSFYGGGRLRAGYANGRDRHAVGRLCQPGSQPGIHVSPHFSLRLVTGTGHGNHQRPERRGGWLLLYLVRVVVD